jgi:hypothetical protein
MIRMKSNSVTRGISIGLLVVYFLWSFFSLPFANILVSASIGLISYASYESIEISSFVVIIIGVLFRTYRLCYREEGFEANNLAVIRPGGPRFKTNGALPSMTSMPSMHESAESGESAETIVKRIASIENKQIKGMLSSSYVEGFADAASVNNPVPDAGSKDVEKKKDDAAAPSSNKPASVKEETVSESFKSQLPGGDAIASFAKDSGKTGAENTGLFRLGSIPTDSAAGPHIDASTTLMSALNALKPDQIKSMTEDTQKLMETQKNLMGMLGAMKPMLQDGKQMMETFGTMFAK